MHELYKFIGEKIRQLRQTYGGKGINQETLAREMGTTSNTISRWETASYKPSPKDLHRLAKFFGVNISVFFPDAENSRIQALLSATGDLDDEDFEDLIQYAQFRKARQALRHAKRGKQQSN